MSDGLVFVSSDPEPNIQSLVTGNAWYIEDMQAGQTQEISVIATVSALVQTGDILYHYVSASSDNSDDNTDNNIVTHALTVEQTADTQSPSTPTDTSGAGG